MQNTLGLYIHVPFCLQKCEYCDFYSIAGTPAQMDAYVKAVIAHIKEAGRFCGKYTVDTVYFGGGTPSLLGVKRLAAIYKACGSAFNLSKNPEITAEVNPGTVDKKLLKKLFRAGFNRLSIGVQTLDGTRLLELGRAHTSEQAASAFLDARTAGFENISVDLLYGLPGHTLEEWRGTLESIIKWQPEHISCYGLKLEEYTPLYAKNPSLPDDDLQADMYLLADELLVQAGFRHYEVSNFAKPSRESRHNMKYWTLQPYMGFGPAAHSDFDGRRFSYVKSIKGYIEGISGDNEVIAQSEIIPEIERAGEYLMLNLRTDTGVSSNEYSRMFRASFDSIETSLKRFEEHGITLRTGDRWRLTPKGFLVSNAVISSILGTAADSVQILNYK
ncbi:MAG: radical SAM family heme chaperone HemW [Oscillospiraceae bacterium]|nr:radical SAM family heme chaperone HemW [Oscillospiraceae bacterium]